MDELFTVKTKNNLDIFKIPVNLNILTVLCMLGMVKFILEFELVERSQESL